MRSRVQVQGPDGIPPRTAFSRRRHIDLLRVTSAFCPGSPSCG